MPCRTAISPARNSSAPEAIDLTKITAAYSQVIIMPLIPSMTVTFDFEIVVPLD